MKHIEALFFGVFGLILAVISWKMGAQPAENEGPVLPQGLQRLVPKEWIASPAQIASNRRTGAFICLALASVAFFFWIADNFFGLQ